MREKAVADARGMMVFSGKLVILLVFILWPMTAMADTILLKSDAWCPYNCAPEEELPGYVIEIADRIFERAGHQFTYEAAPWSRALKMVKEGEITAIVGVTKNEAPELVFPEQECGISIIYFFVRKGFPWRFQGAASLEEVNVGIMADYEYGAELDAYFEKNRDTDRVQSIRSEKPLVLNIRKLLRERIDVIPEDKSVLIHTAKAMGVWDRMEAAGVDPIQSKEGLEESKLYIAFSPKHPKAEAYARLISDGIEAMRESGELNRIMGKYGLEDWREEFRDVIQKYGQ